MLYFWGHQYPHKNDRDSISENCDHEHIPHKMHYLWGPQNVMFLSFYTITVIIAVLFIRTTTMIAVFIKISYIYSKEDCITICPIFQFFVRIAIMVVVFFIKWLQFSENVLFSQSSQRTVIMSRNPHINIVIISRTPSTKIEWSLMIFRSKHK